MIAWLTQFVQTVSFWGLAEMFSAASTTNVVFVLLASKPAFIAASFVAGVVAYRRRHQHALPDAPTADPDRQLSE